MGILKRIGITLFFILYVPIAMILWGITIFIGITICVVLWNLTGIDNSDKFIKWANDMLEFPLKKVLK